MGKKEIRAITFDLWDTLLVDDSDEAKRAAMGLPSKPVERRNLVEEFLARDKTISRSIVDVAYDTVDAAFREVWYRQNVTWTVEQRLSVLLRGLDRELPESDFNDLVCLHENMELKVRPNLAPGVLETLESLYGKYRLAVISDTVFSPGHAVRQLLAQYNILRFFDVLIFSDEVGRSKPEPLVFEKAAADLGVRTDEIVHIGDREEKDVIGPHAVEAKSIYCTAVIDRGSQDTTADAVCSDLCDLPGILEELKKREA
ncbi:MAG: HAD family hydrolase [Proteobacteria bacterium]|nr:HAD family hydrolase [Pseudomonadota bacterium]